MKDKVIIKGNEYPTLVAITQIEQMKGLMGVKPPTPVMTFVYDSPRTNAFWMHNTPAELDIVFACKGKIVAIHKGEPYSTKLIGGDCVSDVVVELPGGTCRAQGISVGDPIDLRITTAAKMDLFLVKLGFDK
jgi:uncharacterized membrane protein (UPF0127 family)